LAIGVTIYIARKTRKITLDSRRRHRQFYLGAVAIASQVSAGAAQTAASTTEATATVER